ncbi:hypothetical protein MES4922_230230 [Mesorhizobium ventifaucium]|uniref:Uncharacterized protein n=1 Tax=Mesorhizobium ventifaucium TaxID=666020 RepID=A0ABN8JQ79_9HYPH|nr:hypothetical protein MES4922_230230 [Mesorhizobium ventifaucium]
MNMKKSYVISNFDGQPDVDHRCNAAAAGVPVLDGFPVGHAAAGRAGHLLPDPVCPRPRGFPRPSRQ